MFREAVRSTGVRRKQSLILLVAAFPGLVMNVISNAGVTPVDVTLLGFPAALAVLAWALFRADFLDIIPVARATVVESMNDPVVTLDREDRVVDRNEAALDLVGCDAREGTPVDEFFESVPQLAETIRTETAATDTLSVKVDGTERVFDVTISPIRADDAAPTSHRGRIVVVRDITEPARQRRRIERQNERLERLADAFEDVIVV